MKVAGTRVAVTGGAGFIGGHLVDRLLALDCEVVVVDDFSSGSRDNLAQHAGNQRLSVVEGCVCDERLLASTFAGVQSVLHLATRNVRLSLRRPSEVHEVNTTGTLRVLQAACATGAQRVLYCSSSEVNGTAEICPLPEDYHFKPETIYGASKLAGEYYAQVFQRAGWIETVVARPHNNYGPRQHWHGHSGEVIPRFILWSFAGEPCLVHGDGLQTRDFTFVTETADYLVRLLECDQAVGQAVNLCRGEEVSIVEIARLVAELTGSGVPVRHLPARPSDVLRLWGDNSRLRSLLGDTPRIGIREGLEREVAWFKAHVPVTPEVLAGMRPETWGATRPEPWLEALSARKAGKGS